MCALLLGCAGDVSPRVALPAQAVAPVASVRGTLLPDQRRFEIAHGVIVDVAGRGIFRELVSEPVWNEANDGELAYEHVRDEIRAHRITTGRLAWRQPQACDELVPTSAGLFCTGPTDEVTLLHRATGRAQVIARLGYPISTMVRAGPRVVVLGRWAARAVFFDADTGRSIGELDLPAPMRVATTTPEGRVCGVAGKTALCFDAAEHVVWSRALASPVTLWGWDARDLLVSTGNETAALSVIDGHDDARIIGWMGALVRTESGRIAGFMRAPPSLAFVDTDGHERWTADSFPYTNSVTALLVGEHVIVATYDRFSAGAWLAAFDRRSGVKRWTGEVETLAIAHSAYSNDVELRLEAGAVVMRGREAMQDYLELFDPSTGERLLSTVRYRP